jgi:hypothetical protein
MSSTGARLRLLAWVFASLLACARSEAPPDAGPPPADTRDMTTTLVDAKDRATPRFRAQLVGELARAHQAAGSATRARSLFELELTLVEAVTDATDRERLTIHAAETARALGDSTRATALAGTLARADARDEARARVDDDLATLARLPPAHGDAGLLRVARAWAAAGRFDAAGDALERVRDGALSAEGLGVLARARLAAGGERDVAGWTRTTEGVARSEVQAALALHYLRAHKLKQAEKATRSIESEVVRARALAEQAAHLPAASPEAMRRFAEARRLAELVRDPELQRAAYEALIVAHLDAAPDRAARLFDVLGKRDGEARLASRTAAALVARGLLDEAIALRPRFERDPLWCGEGLGAIAAAQAARGDHAAALATLAAIPQLEQRLPALARAAVAWGPPRDGAEREALTALVVGAF